MTTKEQVEQIVANAHKAMDEYNLTLDEAITQWEATVAMDVGSLESLEKVLLNISFAAFAQADRAVQRAVGSALAVQLVTGQVSDNEEMSRRMTEIIEKVERCAELQKQIKEKHGV